MNDVCLDSEMLTDIWMFVMLKLISLFMFICVWFLFLLFKEHEKLYFLNQRTQKQTFVCLCILIYLFVRLKLYKETRPTMFVSFGSFRALHPYD